MRRWRFSRRPWRGPEGAAESHNQSLQTPNFPFVSIGQAVLCAALCIRRAGCWVFVCLFGRPRSTGRQSLSAVNAERWFNNLHRRSCFRRHAEPIFLLARD
jgi:hypothetical protein